MPDNAEGRWEHREAREVFGSQMPDPPNGDTVVMECSVCGKSWTKELAQ